MKMKMLQFFLLFTVLLVGSTAAIASMEFHPRLLVEEEYNDNIFLTSSDETEDWITTIEPGVNFIYNNRSVAATIDYSLRYQLYKNDSDRNHNDFNDVQRANANVLFFDGRPFTLRLSEVISRETLDDREHSSEYSELVNRSTVYNSTVAPEYRLQLFPTLSFVTGYTYDRYDYVDRLGNDTEEHEGRISLVKQISPETEIYARGAYVVHESEASADEYYRHDYTLGMTYHLGGHTTVGVEGGYSRINFDNDNDFDDDTPIWMIDVDYQLSGPFTFTLGYLQEFSTTASEGTAKLREANIGIEYVRGSQTALVELYWDDSKYVQYDREDEVFGIRFDFAQPLGKALTLNIDAEYERGNYTDPKVTADENVDRFEVGTSFDYTYRRFIASLGYRFQLNESDLSGRDYANNIVTLSGTVRF